MKREILFRGKRMDNGYWVYGYLYITHTGEYEIGSYNKELDIERWTAVVDPATVGQYTGVKDKNGVKIFDGDVLKFVGDAALCITEAEERFPVEYKTTGESACGYGLPDCFEYEVIGNIHDNPELLEGNPQ